MPTATTSGWDRAACEADLTLWLADAVPLFFRLVPSGVFRMGSRGESAAEEPPHRVHITRAFYLGTFPVTQAQFAVWTKAQGIEHENEFPNNLKHPAENLDWDQAQAYCQWINHTYETVLPSGYRAALPTEAQWEYACRAGTDMEYYSGDGVAALNAAGWFGEDWETGSTHPVGEKEPNAWGLYDLHGNVDEWCQDAWDEHAYKSRADGVADPVVLPADVGEENPDRVFRGGSWIDSAGNCRSAIRDGWGPGNRDGYLGFRVCLVPGPVAAAGTVEKRVKAEPGPVDGG